MGNGHMIAQSMDDLPLAMNQGMPPMSQAAYSAATPGTLGNPSAVAAMPYRALQPGVAGTMQGAQLVSIQGAPTVQDTGLYEAYGAGV